MSFRLNTWKLACAGMGLAALLHGQVCRLSVAGLNQSRRVVGPMHAECPDEVVHTAPFGNWGVTSNYGQKGNSHQFDGWCHETQTCNNAAVCRLSCTSGWYEWNSCTDQALFQPPNCSLYNAGNCTEQASTTGINVHGTKYVDIPVRCPSVAAGSTQGGCSDVRGYASGTNFMSLYELDPGSRDDLIQTLYFPETAVSLTCDAWGCAPSGSAWVGPSGYDSPPTPAKVYAELATLVNWGAFVDSQRVCNVSTEAVAYVSAASYFGPVLAPGSIASGFGAGLSPVTESAGALPLPTTLGGVSLVITDSFRKTYNAPLFYVSPGQVNFLVPEGVTQGPVTLGVFRGPVPLFSGIAQVESVAPGLFSANSDGKGVASAFALRVSSDGRLSTQPVFVCPGAVGTCGFNPIDLGAAGERTFLELYGTGIRSIPGVTSVSVKIGGVDSTVLYAGPQGQYAGLDQVNVEVPSQLRGIGQADVTLTVASKPANAVTVFIQ